MSLASTQHTETSQIRQLNNNNGHSTGSLIYFRLIWRKQAVEIAGVRCECKLRVYTYCDNAFLCLHHRRLFYSHTVSLNDWTFWIESIRNTRLHPKTKAQNWCLLHNCSLNFAFTRSRIWARIPSLVNMGGETSIRQTLIKLPQRRQDNVKIPVKVPDRQNGLVIKDEAFSCS